MCALKSCVHFSAYLKTFIIRKKKNLACLSSLVRKAEGKITHSNTLNKVWCRMNFLLRLKLLYVMDIYFSKPYRV